MSERMNTREQTHRKNNHKINPAFSTFIGKKKSFKKKVLISVCSCVGWIVQGSEQAQPYKQGCKQPSAYQIRTKGQGEAFMHFWQLSTCERTEVMQGLFNPQSMRYMEMSIRERTTSSWGSGRGILTVTADGGFPTPSSSGREASGAARIHKHIILHINVHSVNTH